MATFTFFKHYTDIPALVHILSRKQLTLRDPKRWDDGNDSHYILAYKCRAKLKTVLVMCFAQCGETYHHWKIFSGGPSGACIHFKKEKLLDAIRQSGTKVKKGDVKYWKLPQIRQKKLTTGQLPFIKRYAFKSENEFRIVYGSKEETTCDIPFALSCIDRITLSPWIDMNLSDSLKKLLNTIDGCEKIKIVRSTLIGNDEWMNISGLPSEQGTGK